MEVMAEAFDKIQTELLAATCNAQYQQIVQKQASRGLARKCLLTPRVVNSEIASGKFLEIC